MKQFTVRDGATGAVLLVYNNDVQLVFDQWPGCTQTDTTPPDPALPPPYQGSWLVTRMAFRRRFTDDEKADLEIAALDQPTAAAAVRKRQAALRVYLADVLAADYIDLSDAYVRGGLSKLEQFGLLAAGRASAIMDTPPTDAEVFK